MRPGKGDWGVGVCVLTLSHLTPATVSGHRLSPNGNDLLTGNAPPAQASPPAALLWEKVPSVSHWPPAPQGPWKCPPSPPPLLLRAAGKLHGK